MTNGLVMAEIVWVLHSYYQQPRADIRDKVLAILNTPGIEVIGGELVFQAVTWFAQKNVDFIDAYNAAWMLAQRMDIANTFDHSSNRRHWQSAQADTKQIGRYRKKAGKNRENACREATYPIKH